jgi:hypothetical protein
MILDAKGEPVTGTVSPQGATITGLLVSFLDSEGNLLNYSSPEPEAKKSKLALTEPEEPAFTFGGSPSLGSDPTRKMRLRGLPDGVCVSYDPDERVWCLRDAYRENPTVGFSESQTQALAALEAYLAQLKRRARRAERMEAGR